MTAQLIDGKMIAQQVRDEIAAKVAKRLETGRSVPTLATVLVGDRTDSATYVSAKQKACAELGMGSISHKLPGDISQEELEKLIKSLNDDTSVHGILVQLPLPSHLTYADVWILLNLTLAIVICVPALNYYTHGTHITVAHAMGSTIGINTMLLFASVFYIIRLRVPEILESNKRFVSAGISITNISLLFFWIALLGSGLVKISGKLNNETFYNIMQKSQPWFNLFNYSGIFIFAGLTLLIAAAVSALKTGQLR